MVMRTSPLIQALVLLICLALAEGTARLRASMRASARSVTGSRGFDLAMIEPPLFYGISGCASVILAVLMVCCVVDAIQHWRHWARFSACERKVRRASEAFSNRKGDLQLCPCCVEPLSSQPSPSKVVFLCGHRFHTACCNFWFLDSPTAAGRCPICEGVGRKISAELTGDQEDENESTAGGSNDESQFFTLLSLHKQFPEIISEECVRRWAKCNTQLWLAELTCPQYNSILQRHRNKTEM